jgi:hypothetical protein
MDEEKRKAVRINKQLAVQFGTKTGETIHWDMSLIKDISESGICIRTGPGLNTDDICYLRFRMPLHPEETLEIAGKIVESTVARLSIYNTRIEFLNLDDNQTRQLREFIAWTLVNERSGK